MSIVRDQGFCLAILEKKRAKYGKKKKKEEVFIFESRVQTKKKMLNEMFEFTGC